jgi:hypothetical protein
MLRWTSLFCAFFLGLQQRRQFVLAHGSFTSHITTMSTTTTTLSRCKRHTKNHSYHHKSKLSRTATIRTRSAFVHHSQIEKYTHLVVTGRPTLLTVIATSNPLLRPPKFIAIEHKKHVALLYESNSSDQNQKDDEKFGWKQRWASVQCLLLGAIVGSIASAPISLFHNLILQDIPNPIAQWEYDTDSSAIIGGLFAIVYRYCIREDANPQLKQGCISAMILIRTLPQIHIPSYCTPVPLNCHHNNDHNLLLQLLPIQYFYIFDDGDVLQQLFWCGLESAVLFTVTAKMMDMAMEKNYIIRFPG